MKVKTLFRTPCIGGPQESAAYKVAEQSFKRMPKVPSLIFDLEMEDGSKPAEAVEESPVLENLARHLQLLVEPCNQVEHNLRMHLQATQEETARQGRPFDINELAGRLQRLGHTVRIRTALGGGGGGECLRNLRHTFLYCTVEGMMSRMNYIIDPKFKEQFEIAHPTERYQKVLDAIPREFVGTEDRITALVEVLCGEMKEAFEQTGVTLPPWRQAGSMLSKWRPRRSEDLSLSQDHAGHGPQKYERRTRSEDLAAHQRPSFAIEASSSQNTDQQPRLPCITEAAQQPQGLRACVGPGAGPEQPSPRAGAPSRGFLQLPYFSGFAGAMQMDAGKENQPDGTTPSKAWLTAIAAKPVRSMLPGDVDAARFAAAPPLFAPASQLHEQLRDLAIKSNRMSARRRMTQAVNSQIHAF
jgi:uncharacterized protein (TIGR01615 family)